VITLVRLQAAAGSVGEFIPPERHAADKRRCDEDRGRQASPNEFVDPCGHGPRAGIVERDYCAGTPVRGGTECCGERHDLMGGRQRIQLSREGTLRQMQTGIAVRDFSVWHDIVICQHHDTVPAARPRNGR
jgi:hypothetical protein